MSTATLLDYGLKRLTLYTWNKFPVPSTFITAKMTLWTLAGDQKRLESTKEDAFFDPIEIVQNAFPFIDPHQLDTLVWGFTDFPYCNEKHFRHQIEVIQKGMEAGHQIIQTLEDAVLLSTRKGAQPRAIFDGIQEMAKLIGLNLYTCEMRIELKIEGWT